MTDSANTAASKKQLVLILSIPIVVVLLSTLLFFLARENIINFGTVNQGNLIRPPVQLSELEPQRQDGSQFLFDLPESRWVFMVVGDQYCRNACERMLYLSRQTRIALGKKTNRVERVYLALEGQISAPLRDFLEDEHDDITVLYADATDFARNMSALDINPRDPQSFYVVDPLGWIMMVYRAEDTSQATLSALGKDVLKDMKRLLQ